MYDISAISILSLYHCISFFAINLSNFRWIDWCFFVLVLNFWFTLSLLLFFSLSVAFGLLLNQNCFDVVVTLWKKANYFFSVRKCFKFFILFSFFRYHGFKIFKKSFEESVREILCNLVKKSLRILPTLSWKSDPLYHMFSIKYIMRIFNWKYFIAVF